MSVGKRVSGAVGKMSDGDAEGALFDICAAIEVTSKREHGHGGASSYKRWVHDNFGLITRIGFTNVIVLNMNVQFKHPDIKPNANGLCSVEQIFYHAVRCGLYHEAKLPNDLKFEFGGQLRTETSGVVVLPAELIFGLIISVIVSPANAAERAEPGVGITHRGLPLNVDLLWGKRPEFMWLLDATDPSRPSNVPDPPPSSRVT